MPTNQNEDLHNKFKAVLHNKFKPVLHKSRSDLFFKNLKNNHVENNQYCTISKKNYVNVIRPLPRYLITIGTLVGVNFMGRL